VRRLSLVGAVLSTAGLILLLTPAGGAVGTAAQQVLGKPPAPTAGPGLPSPPIPWLTDAQKSEAARILAADPRTKAIFKGASYAVADIGPFTSEDNRLMGAAMIIHLDAPNSFPVVEWPAIEPAFGPGSSFPHYRERTLPASATSISDFDVLVDLNRGRLISLRPRNAERMKIAPTMKPWPAPSGD
jgi:hypothetical protein